MRKTGINHIADGDDLNVSDFSQEEAKEGNSNELQNTERQAEARAASNLSNLKKTQYGQNFVQVAE